MRIVIELKRGAPPKKVLNQLYKYTPLQSSLRRQLLALVNGEPRLLSLKRILQAYVEHRQEVITRRSRFELRKARERAHILEGLRIALQPGRGDRPHSQRRDAEQRARPDDALRPDRGAGAGDPGPATAPPCGPRTAEDRRRVRAG
jgi:hypothetical protein